jgi:hypothetical protein
MNVSEFNGLPYIEKKRAAMRQHCHHTIVYQEGLLLTELNVVI